MTTHEPIEINYDSLDSDDSDEIKLDLDINLELETELDTKVQTEIELETEMKLEIEMLPEIENVDSSTIDNYIDESDDESYKHFDKINKIDSDNFDFMLNAVTKNYHFLKYASERLKNNSPGRIRQRSGL